ncbi:CubicO group peptidase, beta-lactamase class C family [Saccharopolyspora antimicrobica]|uniref:CubicO group peptidase (Beta-lactamase class C family) n=1 Tax=Saccharopolyspora antimicrobica TaxID=455193 RepID=A0A1I5B4T9_9PSEU|nr:serine hydrolase domain-containing protein [Saccharopolyspora antimicrobica]RKT86464.1 CubicO group peptidase (beta-lactamase class C family) [Saccharopolyspora antimicrobica]SFN69714.1 CubicO group peptidase, beta-lactamase class C family [Saccharopolyspora antimicrobica]
MTAQPTTALAERLQQAADLIDAPDVVFACSEHGHRAVATTGTAPTDRPRQHLHYEIGSASKTFLGLLLADLATAGVLDLDTPVRDCLPTPPVRQRVSAEITLRHLITHTSGLPSIPRQPAFYRHLISGGYSNPYAAFTRQRLLAAFHRHGSRARPGTCWRYSNFATAVLAQALTHVTGTAYADLLTHRVLHPMRLRQTRLAPGPPGTDAEGHRRNGTTPAPPIQLGAVESAGAVRAAPGDLLTYLEAHLTPESSPLRKALYAVRTTHPVSRPRHAPGRSLTWFLDHTSHGPVYFHGGATFGQIAYLGFRPGTRTALVTLATRRHDRRNTLINTAHALLTSTPD